MTIVEASNETGVRIIRTLVWVSAGADESSRSSRTSTIAFTIAIVYFIDVNDGL